MSKSPATTKAGKKLPPIHPGKILLEDLKDEEISINALARAIRVPANRISLIVNEKRGITADTAARLGRYFGTPRNTGSTFKTVSISTLSTMPQSSATSFRRKPPDQRGLTAMDWKLFAQLAVTLVVAAAGAFASLRPELELEPVPEKPVLLRFSNSVLPWRAQGKRTIRKGHFRGDLQVVR